MELGAFRRWYPGEVPGGLDHEDNQNHATDIFVTDSAFHLKGKEDPGTEQKLPIRIRISYRRFSERALKANHCQCMGSEIL